MIHSIELAWFAGFIDGEGCFSADVDDRFVNTVTCGFTVTNTSFHTMGYVIQLLKDLEIPHEVLVDERQKRKCMRIRVRKKEHLVKLLTIVEPFLVTKKVQALIMLKYLSITKVKGSRSIEENTLVEEMKRMNQVSS